MNEKNQGSNERFETSVEGAITDGAPASPSIGYEVTGWRLASIYAGVYLAMFMTSMETYVASTALLAITNELGGYSRSPWIFTAYLLTYSGFPTIWAKLSDIVGRKYCLLASSLIFLVFSAACGGARTLNQLIQFRWLQGIGGCGIYSLALVFFELIPPEKYPTSMSLTSSVIALSLLTGPLIGGAITAHGHWRWIFYINVPVVAFAIVVLSLTFPARLSREPIATAGNRPIRQRIKLIDVLGAVLLLGTTIPLTTALQEASQGRPFSSPVVWVLLLVTGICLFTFFAWQWYITNHRTYPEPLFPWRFMNNRFAMGMVLNSFLPGSVLTACVVQIPQRFMVLFGMSSLAAGIRLLPFALFTPFGSLLGAGLIGRGIISHASCQLLGGIMQLIGTVLFSTVSDLQLIPASQYGYQVLIGTGVGFVTTATILLVPIGMERRDLAVGSGTVAQMRFLGGVVGLAVVTCVGTPYIGNRLLTVLTSEQTNAALERLEVISTFSPKIRDAIMPIFQDGFNLQMKILIGFAAAQIPVSVLTVNRETVSVLKKKSSPDKHRS